LEKRFQYKGSEIYYSITGNGQPVVLLHGFAEDSTIWNDQIEFLRQDCLVVAPDLPGSGKSTTLKKENVTIEDYADWLHALLKNEKIDSCILLGHSMGGYISLAFAEMFPGVLTAFGFVHSTAFADDDAKKDTRKKAIKVIEKYGVHPFLKNSMPNLFSENYKKEHPEIVAELIERGKNFSTKTLIQYYSAIMKRPDRTDVLKKSKVPVLFIIGSDDVATPLADLLKQVHLPAVSYIHILKEVGHMSMLEKPEELNSYLLGFIKNIITS
jgi:pimeloyl-ACP methyl ester carboxylesterase